MKKLRYLLLAWVVLVAGMAALRYLELVDADTAWQSIVPEMVDELDEPFTAPPPGLIESVSGLGFLLIGAWLTGRIFRRLGLPMITGYLVFGVLVGPELHQAMASLGPPAALVPRETLGYLELVNSLAISIIAFTAGGEIRLESLRSGAAHIIAVTFAGVVLVFAGMCGVLMVCRPLIPILRDQPIEICWMICIIVSAIAIANSPATVLALIKETDARGPMSQIGLAVTVCKDLVLVILFAVLMAMAIRFAPGVEDQIAAEAPAAPGAPGIPNASASSGIIQHLAWHLLVSIAMGALAGILFRLAIRRVADHMGIFVIGAGFGLALFSEALELEPLLVSLSAGFVLANLWPRQSEHMFNATEELSMPVYCVFFAVAGASIRIDAVISLWPLALFIVVVRGTLVWLSTWIGASVTRLKPPARTWMGTAFLAQAGVSIALVTQVSRAFEGYGWSEELASLLLAVIAIHQLIGPPLMRFGLIRAGEIRLDGQPR